MAPLVACVAGRRVSTVICRSRAFKHRGNCGNHRDPPSAGTGCDLRAFVVLQPRVLLEIRKHFQGARLG